MICAYMLHKKVFEDPDEALRHYGKSRTRDEKVFFFLNPVICLLRFAAKQAAEKTTTAQL